MFSNVIVDIAFPRRSFVFGQSSCKVSASLTDVGGAAVGAIILYTAPFLFLGSSLSLTLVSIWLIYTVYVKEKGESRNYFYHLLLYDLSW